MKIAIYSNSFPVLSETFIINQIIGLSKLGVDVDVYSNEINKDNFNIDLVKDNNLEDLCYSSGLDVIQNRTKKVMLLFFYFAYLVMRFDFLRLKNIIFDDYLMLIQKANLIAALYKLRDNQKLYSNIIVHFGNNGYYVCKMRELGLINGPISVVFHGHELSVHNTYNKFKKQYQKIFEVANLMLPISEFWKEKLIELGCQENKIKVHRMGVNSSFLQKNNELDVNNNFKRKGVLNLIQVGRLTEKKAILDSINAVVEANESIPISFTIIGDGELFDEAKKLIHDLNADEYIHLLGKKYPLDVERLLDNSDVFILPSVRARNGDMEGVPVALMEAMAKRLIVISTKHSGIPELIENNKSGFLVDESSVSQIKNAIITIYNMNDSDLKCIKDRAYQVVCSKYNNDILNKLLLDMVV